MKKTVLQLTLIMCFWFTISFITNILGPLIPDIIRNFQLTDLAMAGFIPTSFFLAYAIMSIPAGIMIDRWGEKLVLFCGFLMPFIGTVLFACLHTYPALLASSFIIGLGMAMLQTVLNPLQRTVGGEENYAFVAELAQFVFGTASFVSPLVYAYLIRELNPEVYQPGKNVLLDCLSTVTPSSLPWVSLYWVFALLLLVMLVAVALSKFPKIELKEDEKSGSQSSYFSLFRQKFVWLFFLGIFCYVSTEQGTSIFMSTFLEQYHGVNPQTEGAVIVSYFWGLMTVGCLLGMVLLKLVDSKRLLQVSGGLTIVLLLVALLGSKEASMIAFPAIGFSISMMYSIVFSLALNSASQYHGSFAGILCSGIVGGAGGPLIISTLSDMTSLRTGMLVILVFVGYITFIGFWAKPLVSNKTVSLKELFHRK
ncbi:sugar MFS transporter [Phocaeicola faecicola]|uniref:sugar MFS transporter n=1 Tax=Phocaeicola faecicola TaxID=2739389 RepID=UPI002A7F698F|nr:sugar MFS transporter [Phocaeicola faecicola]MCI5743800.1 sugar MFS transporter [Bacteroides sp.]MDD6908235.1 sugar MFS transporter [Bacteroidaceae bacterium]MDY4871668.1 sugar MFS transporter [Phocaeicola faecicola]